MCPIVPTLQCGLAAAVLDVADDGWVVNDRQWKEPKSADSLLKVVIRERSDKLLRTEFAQTKLRLRNKLYSPNNTDIL